MSQYHEMDERLNEQSRSYTRALNSLKEEIEAVDWYNQRITASENEELNAILAHNRDEEIEHACMLIEWLRRNMDAWDENLKTYLFTEGSITELEDEATNKNSGGKDFGLNIGDLK